MSRDEAAGLNKAACLTAYVSTRKAITTKKGVCSQAGGCVDRLAHSGFAEQIALNESAIKADKGITLVYCGERVTRVYAPRRGGMDAALKRKKREHGTSRSGRVRVFFYPTAPVPTGRALTLPL